MIFFVSLFVISKFNFYITFSLALLAPWTWKVNRGYLLKQKYNLTVYYILAHLNML